MPRRTTLGHWEQHGWRGSGKQHKSGCRIMTRCYFFYNKLIDELFYDLCIWVDWPESITRSWCSAPSMWHLYDNHGFMVGIVVTYVYADFFLSWHQDWYLAQFGSVYLSLAETSYVAFANQLCLKLLQVYFESYLYTE